MDTLVMLLSIALVNVLAWITPGPNMIAVMSASLSHGRRHGVLTGLGLSACAVLWASLAVLGVTALFELYPDLVLGLRLAGAAYLLWLGYKALRSAVAPDQSELTLERSDLKGRKAFLTGFLVSATNPKAALFFGSILTAFVPVGASAELLVGIVVLCGLLAVAGHSVTATVFSSDLVVRKFNAARRAITAAFGLVFTGLGLGVAYDAIRRV